MVVSLPRKWRYQNPTQNVFPKRGNILGKKTSPRKNTHIQSHGIGHVLAKRSWLGTPILFTSWLPRGCCPLRLSIEGLEKSSI